MDINNYKDWGNEMYSLESCSVQFKSKIMNFRALIILFFKKISSLALLNGMLGRALWFLSHSSNLTLLIISSYVHTSTLY